MAAAFVVLAGSCQKGPSNDRNHIQNNVGKLATLNVIAAAPPLGTLIDGAIYRIRGMSSLPDGPVVEVTATQRQKMRPYSNGRGFLIMDRNGSW